MPRKLETDRSLFLVTLTLCLIGAVMVFSASAVTAREQYGNGYHFLLRQLLWLGFGLAGLVLLEPDLGTAFEIFLIALAMLFVAGLSPAYLLGAGLAAIPILYLAVMRVPYRYERVMAFLHPEAD